MSRNELRKLTAQDGSENGSTPCGTSPDVVNGYELSPEVREARAAEEAYRKAAKRATYALRAYNAQTYDVLTRALDLTDALRDAKMAAERLADALENMFRR